MEHSSSHLLSVILFTPLLGALILLFVPRESQILHRLIGNLFGVLGFLVSLPLMLHFPAGSGGYEFKETADWIPSIGAKYSLGADGISMLLVMLTTLLDDPEMVVATVTAPTKVVEPEPTEEELAALEAEGELAEGEEGAEGEAAEGAADESEAEPSGDEGTDSDS